MDTVTKPDHRRKTDSGAFGKHGFEAPSQILSRLSSERGTWNLFAAAALAGLLAKYGGNDPDTGLDTDSIVGIAARCADSMLELIEQDAR